MNLMRAIAAREPETEPTAPGAPWSVRARESRAAGRNPRAALGAPGRGAGGPHRGAGGRRPRAAGMGRTTPSEAEVTLEGRTLAPLAGTGAGGARRHVGPRRSSSPRLELLLPGLELRGEAGAGGARSWRARLETLRVEPATARILLPGWPLVVPLRVAGAGRRVARAAHRRRARRGGQRPRHAAGRGEPRPLARRAPHPGGERAWCSRSCWARCSPLPTTAPRAARWRAGWPRRAPPPRSPRRSEDRGRWPLAPVAGGLGLGRRSGGAPRRTARRPRPPRGPRQRGRRHHRHARRPAPGPLRVGQGERSPRRSSTSAVASAPPRSPGSCACSGCPGSCRVPGTWTSRPAGRPRIPALELEGSLRLARLGDHARRGPDAQGLAARSPQAALRGDRRPGGGAHPGRARAGCGALGAAAGGLAAAGDGGAGAARAAHPRAGRDHRSRRSRQLLLRTVSLQTPDVHWRSTQSARLSLAEGVSLRDLSLAADAQRLELDGPFLGTAAGRAPRLEAVDLAAASRPRRSARGGTERGAWEARSARAVPWSGRRWWRSCRCRRADWAR